jgi:erythromycin esterase-like protein
MNDIAAIARPLHDAGDLDVLLDRAAGARVVLIGEASHGTHEFYTWRDALTRRLIEERGFDLVAVEGDWPDCARVDAAVRGAPGAPADPRAALLAYERWPTWMWANEEVVDFARWVRQHNERNGRQVGFHGLDLYSLWESLHEVLVWLREHDPAGVPAALEAYRCLEPFHEDPNAYAYATRFADHSCQAAVVRMLVELRGRDLTGWQNAEVVAGAEHYYRAMTQGGPKSWNVRDRHFDETLDRLLRHHEKNAGRPARAVVWAHNTHVGDARATDQTAHGEVTLGELVRERYGPENVVLVGFGSHHGTVVAGRTWGAPMELMGVPPARRGSLEDVLHAEAPPQSLFVFPPLHDRPELLVDEIGHRAIGVVYRPERDSWGNYVPTVLGDRYDAFVWIDEAHALRPLHTLKVDRREPETYPSGM